MTERTLYSYQEKVANLLLAGQSVILQAPTGSGKTTAALLPFLHARKNLTPDKFPTKCIYSVPMRVLANQFYAEYQKIIRQYGWQDTIQIAKQTGDEPNDPRVEADLVFTTVDQTLSSFLNIPYGVGTRQANINAGAILSSYLVFDELHLYDPDIMLPSVLEMLRMLKGITPFLIMTATFSLPMLNKLGNLLDAVVVPEDEDKRFEMETIGSQVGKTRRFHRVDSPLTAEVVMESLSKAQRVLCICNTVKAAQFLYLDLRKILSDVGDNQTQLRLLHSRFYKDDRDRHEDWIREQFGTDQAKYSGPKLIQIATQVIEVGVDATCDVLHTEIAPAASILQRAGRCARRAYEAGDVYVYLPRTEEGEPDFIPYYFPKQHKQTQRGKQLCEETWDALGLPEFQDQHMSFAQEQRFIDRVHGPVDGEILNELATNRPIHQDKMLRTIQTADRGMASELIRNSDTRYVVVHPDPIQDDGLRRNPWYYDGFSLYPSTIAKAFDLLEKEDASTDAPWIMQAVAQIEGKDRSDREAPQRTPPEYRWYSLHTSSEVYQSPVIAVHPALVSYDAELGFSFEPSDGKYDLHRRPGKHPIPNYGYSRETFAEHVAGLYRAYKSMTVDSNNGFRRQPLSDEVAYALDRIENNPEFSLSTGSLDRLLRLLFACHDLGKLNTKWQRWAHRWQEMAGEFYAGKDLSLPPNYMAAHTDTDSSKEQKEAQKKLGKRPNHAGESAMAAGHVLVEACGGDDILWRAAMTAIARHHHPLTESYQAYICHPAGLAAFRDALELVGLKDADPSKILWKLGDEHSLSNCLINFDKRETQGLLLYFLLVRVLRLADQRSQEK